MNEFFEDIDNMDGAFQQSNPVESARWEIQQVYDDQFNYNK
jgi:hypothetical protein